MSVLDNNNFIIQAFALTAPKILTVNNRLTNELIIFHEYTTKLKKELGGYLVRNSNGKIGAIGVQKGEGREVVIQPNEQLQGRERYLGLLHHHPITNTFSLWDIGSFLANPLEFISGVTGEDGSFNLTIKTPYSKTIRIEDIDALAKNYDQSDIPELANAFAFLYYRGMLKDQSLELQNSSALTMGQDTLDDFLSSIPGLNYVPEFDTDSSKKCPM